MISADMENGKGRLVPCYKFATLIYSFFPFWVFMGTSRHCKGSSSRQYN